MHPNQSATLNNINPIFESKLFTFAVILENISKFKRFTNHCRIASNINVNAPVNSKTFFIAKLNVLRT